MEEELKQALRQVRDKLLSNPVSPRVSDPGDINLHYCRYVAETVAEQMDDEIEMEILEDGGRGHVHTWLRYDGRHYDAECIDGVDDYRDLPFFQRHPEATIHVEPGTTNPVAIRTRGREPLYPDIFTSETSEKGARFGGTDYWIQAVGGVILGVLLLLIGLIGNWAIHEQVLRRSPALQILFYDLEIFGEMIALVSPIVFFFLLPAHRRRTHL